MTKVSDFILRCVFSVRGPPFPNSIWECYALILSSLTTSSRLCGISAAGPISFKVHCTISSCKFQIQHDILSKIRFCNWGVLELSKLGVLTVSVHRLHMRFHFPLDLPQWLVGLDIINMTRFPKACLQLGNICLSSYMFRYWEDN